MKNLQTTPCSLSSSCNSYGGKILQHPGSINSVKSINFLPCHSPLHSPLPSFQSPSLAPFLLLFPPHPAHSRPFVMRSLQRVGWAQSDPARPRCPLSLQPGLCCTHPRTPQRGDSSPQARSTGQGSSPPELQ